MKPWILPSNPLRINIPLYIWKRGWIVVGTTMGHYKVIENIGQGNMGQVDRATDTKLNRGVAIPVLAEYLSKRGSPLSKRRTLC